jgi:hypothetical protein
MTRMRSWVRLPVRPPRVTRTGASEEAPENSPKGLLAATRSDWRRLQDLLHPRGSLGDRPHLVAVVPVQRPRVVSEQVSDLFDPRAGVDQERHRGVA